MLGWRLVSSNTHLTMKRVSRIHGFTFIEVLIALSITLTAILSLLNAAYMGRKMLSSLTFEYAALHVAHNFHERLKMGDVSESLEKEASALLPMGRVDVRHEKTQNVLHLTWGNPQDPNQLQFVF